MKTHLITFILLIFGLLFYLHEPGMAIPAATSTPEPTFAPGATATALPTSTDTPAPTPTITPTSTDTVTPTTTVSQGPTPTTETGTPTPTPCHMYTDLEWYRCTPTPEETPTITPTYTETITPVTTQETPTPTFTAIVVVTATVPTPTPTSACTNGDDYWPCPTATPEEPDWLCESPEVTLTGNVIWWDDLDDPYCFITPNVRRWAVDGQMGGDQFINWTYSGDILSEPTLGTIHLDGQLYQSACFLLSPLPCALNVGEERTNWANLDDVELEPALYLPFVQ